MAESKKAADAAAEAEAKAAAEAEAEAAAKAEADAAALAEVNAELAEEVAAEPKPLTELLAASARIDARIKADRLDALLEAAAQRKSK